MDWSLFAIGATGWGDELLRGFGLTVLLGLTAAATGTALGLLAALCELARFRAAAWLVAAGNLVLRSLPELLVIFLMYYGAAFALQALLSPFGVDGLIEVSAFWAAMIALARIHAAYASQGFRGALTPIPAGQVEAAHSLGMTRSKTFLRIKLPIAIRLALPGLANLLLTTLKNTPFVSAIGLQDLIRAAGDAGQNTKYYFQFYMASLVVYLVIAGGALAFQVYYEGRVFRHLRRVPA